MFILNNEKIGEVENFISQHLSRSLVINTSTYTYKDINLYNLKTRNFRQDIGFVVFISKAKDLGVIYDILLSFIKEITLKNYVIYIYLNQDDIYTYRGENKYIKEVDSSLFKFNYLDFFRLILKLEGYRFELRSSKLKVFKE